MKRVRYTKTEEGGLTATVTTAKGEALNVVVGPGNAGGVVAYTVKNGLGEVLSQGLDLTLAGVKRQVRAQLTILGVGLGQETRVRGGKGLVHTTAEVGTVGVTGDLDGQGTSGVKTSLFS